MNVEKCVSCQSQLNPNEIYFSYRGGGVLCKKCFGSDKLAEKINSDVAKILRIIFKKNWETLLKLKADSFSWKMLDGLSEKAFDVFSPANY